MAYSQQLHISTAFYLRLFAEFGSVMLKPSQGQSIMVNALVIRRNTQLQRAEKALRAAQYVRMSTDHQKYSIQNQLDAIAEYAALRGYSLTRTYADEGRSGLRLDGRNALKQLITDVQNRQANYEVILVYDVSRWGRFQDADESAYYEFICKDAGIQIIYCAEEFENDGSVSSTVLKNIKRAMAGEYSRELSNKVFIGQCRTAKMGFWRGGQAPFGLRRQLLDEHGRPRMQMEYRQRKILQTDRVVLMPGPSTEIATVRRVFRSYVIERKSITTIASELNADEIRTTRGMKWTANAIDIMLTNETYLGNIVFNRRSFKLQRTYVDNPPEMWIRHDKALAPVVSPATFRKAQQLRRRRVEGMTDSIASLPFGAAWAIYLLGLSKKRMACHLRQLTLPGLDRSQMRTAESVLSFQCVFDMRTARKR